MSDRRRINGPPGGTAPPRYLAAVTTAAATPAAAAAAAAATRRNEMRKIFLKTGLTPSASGSAYLELHPHIAPEHHDRTTAATAAIASPKLACVVHGPRPLPRSASFTPHALLTTHVKFAPFATRQRGGRASNASNAAVERDLAVHVETALRGMLLADRWPKSSIELVITVLEMAEAPPGVTTTFTSATTGNTTTTTTTSYGRGSDWAVMSLLASCITVASAAIADAGIDCVDLVAGGVSALVPARAPGRRRQQQQQQQQPDDDDDDAGDKNSGIVALQTVVDPYPPEHSDVRALCVVGYMPTRDEITQIWVNGEIPGDDSVDGSSSGGGGGGVRATTTTPSLAQLMDEAVRAAVGSYSVLSEAVQETAVRKAKHAGLTVEWP